MGFTVSPPSLVSRLSWIGSSAKSEWNNLSSWSRESPGQTPRNNTVLTLVKAACRSSSCSLVRDFDLVESRRNTWFDMTPGRTTQTRSSWSAPHNTLYAVHVTCHGGAHTEKTLSASSLYDSHIHSHAETRRRRLATTTTALVRLRHRHHAGRRRNAYIRHGRQACLSANQSCHPLACRQHIRLARREARV